MKDKMKLDNTVDKIFSRAINLMQFYTRNNRVSHTSSGNKFCRHAGRQTKCRRSLKSLKLAVDQNNRLSTLFSQGTALFQQF